ncbi:MAG: hypothetical protein ACM3NP_03510 [Actinomycetota bacterium]|jgi:hypothetical protein
MTVLYFSAQTPGGSNNLMEQCSFCRNCDDGRVFENGFLENCTDAGVNAT